jgi:hypothetical protein
MNDNAKVTMLFPLGKLMQGPNLVEIFEEADEYAFDYLMPYAAGDWPEMTPEQQENNCQAIKNGGEIYAEYTLSNCARIAITTTADRSTTTITVLGDDC